MINFIFANISSVAIPVVVMGIGAVSKKLASKKPWHKAHFRLGIELVLVAFASTTFLIADQLVVSPGNAFWALLFLLACFLCLVTVISLHQDWEGDDVDAGDEENDEKDDEGESDGGGRKSRYWITNLIGVVLLGVGLVLNRLGQCEDALVYIDRALKVSSGSARAWMERAICHAHMRHYYKGVLAWDRAIEIDAELALSGSYSSEFLAPFEDRDRGLEGIRRALSESESEAVRARREKMYQLFREYDE